MTIKVDKAKKAAEAARRAEELAEQARQAAEEAKAALREAEDAADTDDAPAPAKPSTRRGRLLRGRTRRPTPTEDAAGEAEPDSVASAVAGEDAEPVETATAGVESDSDVGAASKSGAAKSRTAGAAKPRKSSSGTAIPEADGAAGGVETGVSRTAGGHADATKDVAGTGAGAVVGAAEPRAAASRRGVIEPGEAAELDEGASPAEAAKLPAGSASRASEAGVGTAEPAEADEADEGEVGELGQGVSEVGEDEDEDEVVEDFEAVAADEDDEDDEVADEQSDSAEEVGSSRRRVRVWRAKDAAVADDADEDADEAEYVRGGSRTTLVVLGVIAVLLAGLIAYLVMEKRELAAVERARNQARHAATLAAQDISSYDYRTMDSDLRRALGHTTGKFRTEFEREIPRVKSAAQSSKTIVEGTAMKTGIEDASADRVVALVYLNQQTVKESSTQQLPTQYRIRMTMVKVDGQWLVEKLEMV